MSHRNRHQVFPEYPEVPLSRFKKNKEKSDLYPIEPSSITTSVPTQLLNTIKKSPSVSPSIQLTSNQPNPVDNRPSYSSPRIPDSSPSPIEIPTSFQKPSPTASISTSIPTKSLIVSPTTQVTSNKPSSNNNKSPHSSSGISDSSPSPSETPSSSKEKKYPSLSPTVQLTSNQLSSDHNSPSHSSPRIPDSSPSHKEIPTSFDSPSPTASVSSLIPTNSPSTSPTAQLISNQPSAVHNNSPHSSPGTSDSSPSPSETPSSSKANKDPSLSPTVQLRSNQPSSDHNSPSHSSPRIPDSSLSPTDTSVTSYPSNDFPCSSWVYGGDFGSTSESTPIVADFKYKMVSRSFSRDLVEDLEKDMVDYILPDLFPLSCGRKRHLGQSLHLNHRRLAVEGISSKPDDIIKSNATCEQEPTDTCTVVEARMTFYTDGSDNLTSFVSSICTGMDDGQFKKGGIIQLACVDPGSFNFTINGNERPASENVSPAHEGMTVYSYTLVGSLATLVAFSIFAYVRCQQKKRPTAKRGRYLDDSDLQSSMSFDENILPGPPAMDWRPIHDTGLMEESPVKISTIAKYSHFPETILESWAEEDECMEDSGEISRFGIDESSSDLNMSM